MTQNTMKGDTPAPKLVRRKLATWISILVGLSSAAVSAAIIMAIDRPHRAPLGAWISDFAKSPGLGGISALAAASLALWGIFTQVSVSKRSLEHQRQIDENRAWWERFEWAATRAVPSSKDELPLPYEAVLSTLTGLTETASDDVQRKAVGAITEVAAKSESRMQPTADLAADDSSSDTMRRKEALQKYSDIAGDSPARSAAVEEQLYDIQLIEALKRLAPLSEIRIDQVIRSDPHSTVIEADAIMHFKGKQIVIEIKRYRKPRKFLSRDLRVLSNLLKAADADAVVVVAPVEITIDPPSQIINMVTAIWESPKDDEALRAALNTAAA